MIEKLTLHILPSSSKRAKCVGPTTIAFTGTRRLPRADGTVEPNLFSLSDTCFNLKLDHSKLMK